MGILGGPAAQGHQSGHPLPVTYRGAAHAAPATEFVLLNLMGSHLVPGGSHCQGSIPFSCHYVTKILIPSALCMIRADAETHMCIQGGLPLGMVINNANK